MSMIVLWLAVAAGVLTLIEHRRPKAKTTESKLNQQLSKGQITPAEYRSKMAALQRHPDQPASSRR